MAGTLSNLHSQININMSWDTARRHAWHSVSPMPPQPLKITTTNDATPSQSSSSSSTKDDPSPISEIDTPEPNFLGLTTHPFSFSSMARNSIFGLSVGSITGAGFGFMDGMKTVQEDKALKTLSNKGKGSYIFNGVGRHAGGFGVFFGGYHTVKYLGRTYVDPGDWQLIIACSAVGLGGISYRPDTRKMFPYALMLIAMDSFNELYRDGPRMN